MSAHELRLATLDEIERIARECLPLVAPLRTDTDAWNVVEALAREAIERGSVAVWQVRLARALVRRLMTLGVLESIDREIAAERQHAPAERARRAGMTAEQIKATAPLDAALREDEG